MKKLTKNVARASAALAAVSLFSLSSAFAEDKHDHDHDHAVAGPNGGKVIHDVHPHAELFVTKDRKIQITILDKEGKAAKPGDQTIAVVCGKRTSPTRMKFEKTETAFLSDKPLPEGMNIPTIVRFKMGADSEPKTVRLNLNLADCPTCKHLEYACTCDHDHE